MAAARTVVENTYHFYQNCLHCSFVVVVVLVTDYDSPQSSSNWAPFSTFFPTQLRGGATHSLEKRVRERLTEEEECNYSLGVSGALLRSADDSGGCGAQGSHSGVHLSSRYNIMLLFGNNISLF